MKNTYVDHFLELLQSVSHVQTLTPDVLQSRSHLFDLFLRVFRLLAFHSDSRSLPLGIDAYLTSSSTEIVEYCRTSFQLQLIRFNFTAYAETLLPCQAELSFQVLYRILQLDIAVHLILEKILRLSKHLSLRERDLAERIDLL